MPRPVAVDVGRVHYDALQYAATFGYTVWLRPHDGWLGNGYDRSGEREPTARPGGQRDVPLERS